MPILHPGLDLPMATGRAVLVLWVGLAVLCWVGYLLYRDYRAYHVKGGETP